MEEAGGIKYDNDISYSVDRCLRIIELEKIKDIRKIPNLPEVRFDEYDDSRYWKANPFIRPLLALTTPIRYMVFRYYQKKAKSAPGL